MTRFRRTYIAWFAVLITFFVLANLAGTVQPMGLKPFRTVGFPFTFAEWGPSEGWSVTWVAMAGNVVAALVVTTAVAWLCARANRRAARRAGIVTENQV